MNLLTNLDVYKELLNSLSKRENINVSGLTKEATGHFLVTLLSNVKRPVFVVLESDIDAKRAYDNLSEYYPDKVFYLPQLELSLHTQKNYEAFNKSHRLKTLKALASREDFMVITHPQSLIMKYEKKDDFMTRVMNVDFNSLIDPQKFSAMLKDRGYERTQIVQAKGEYSVRGSIIDVFQVSDERPVRIELFGDEVDSIRTFDVNSQLSVDNLESLDIYPNNEFSLADLDYDSIYKNIEKDLEKTKEIYGLEVFKHAKNRFDSLKDTLNTDVQEVNPNLLIPYIDRTFVGITDYLPEDTLIVTGDLSRISQSNSDTAGFLYEEYINGVESGDLLSKHSQSYLSEDTVWKLIKHFQYLNFSQVSKRVKNFSFDRNIEINSIENTNFQSRWADFIASIKDKLDKGYRIVIFTDGMDRKGQIKDQLEEEDIYPLDLVVDSEIESGIYLTEEHISSGFEYPDDKTIFISFYEIFDKKRKQKAKPKKIINTRDFLNYTDLEVGDYVVHENYGVGKYLGIKNIEVQGSKIDYIEIHYRNEDKLFIPVTEMGFVSKYVGNGEKKPNLSKLYSSDWTKTTTRAKKAIDKIADDLVELYAKRAKIEGFQFSKDTPWQKEFEDAFIFEETPSQLKSIEEIKEDMEKNIPMDRLLCGDVGYGKTEVAFRAAFKAIMDGKQVVMLAPTTILVKQHYKNMLERFASFPIEVQYLSRFKTPRQADDVKLKLRKGQIDFVVGTHALLAESVKFKDLGLLIVDEEQRFGVKDKEKIKTMAENIDVLTLSATPIPRTLQMSLSGIREMSLLDEPPQNRLPVNTYIMEYDPVAIRLAITKELARNGQVYFVFNRVNGIEVMKRHLEELVPGATIAITHGQMSSRQIDNILDSFMKNEIDILLTTTIIETGMDIQNVNTIIIYNADMMGLSQLYQLKGRIGRSDRSSYAYFTYEKHKALSEIAEKRLKAIKDFNELGSGYKIAMRDLELRGAGNLLGESQSGHIESIGYDLYVKMLKEAIDKIKGVESAKKSTSRIDLRIDAFIPSSYIEDSTEKINMYKKISFIESKEDYESIMDELIDRFGDYPDSVQNILDLALIRSKLDQIGINEMVEVEKEVEFRYNDFRVFNVNQIESLSKVYNGFLRFDLRDVKKIIISNDKNLIKNTFELLNNIIMIKGATNEKD